MDYLPCMIFMMKEIENKVFIYKDLEICNEQMVQMEKTNQDLYHQNKQLINENNKLKSLLDYNTSLL